MMRTRTNYRGRAHKYIDSQPLWDYIQDHRTSVLLGSLFPIGVILGTSVVRTLDATTVQGLLTLLNGFVDARQKQGLAETLVSAMAQNMILLVLLFFCGFCAISGPVVFLVPAFKGLGYGLTAGAMLAFYGMRALPFVGFLMLPNTLLATIILIVACEDALKMSRHFLAIIKSVDIPRGEQPAPGKYCLRFLFLFFAMIGGALIESYLFHFGEGLFSL